MSKIVSFALLLIIIYAGATGGVQARQANPTLNPKVEFASGGDGVVALFTYDIPEQYHAYAHENGGGGLPTSLELTVENSGKAPVIYPRGKEENDVFDKRKKVWVYSGRVALLALLPDEAAGAMYAFKLDMLLCSSRHCVPSKEAAAGQIPKNLPLLADVPWRGEAEALLKRRGESAGSLSMEEGQVPKPIELTSALRDPTDAIRAAEKEIKGNNAAAHPDEFDLDLTPRYAAETIESYTLWKSVLLGVLAGLLLNVMPCVLPVLTLKVSGLFLMGGSGDREKLRCFREHNIFFALGVLAFFTCLAVGLGAADLMWGQLYQNQTLLLCVLLLVFLMGLSMLGVFNLPAFDLRVGENSKNPKLKSFGTGFISTFLATPCSGPLLGGVLAWSFAQPAPILLLVFWSVGLGMALPYLVFSLWPSIAKILPRPGDWMYVFEHFLGFLLLATALYLFSILPQAKHMRVLIALLCVAAGAWLWGRFCGLTAPLKRRRICGALCACALIGVVFWISRPAAAPPDWRDFTPENFISSLGKKNMLVEFTADWCPNCKVLEATVLTDKELDKWRKDYDLELIKVDLTQTDPYAQKLLEMLGSKSIPLTAIFAKGALASKPVVLRDLYGKETLSDALDATFAGT